MDPISIVFSPSNQHFAYPGISSSSKCIIIREQSTGHKVSTLLGVPFSIEILSFSSDGRRLATVSYNQPIHVWDVLSGEPVQSIFTGSVGRIYKCTLSADWGAFATVSQDHEIRVYNLREGNNFGESDTHNGIIEKLIRKPIAGPSTGPLLATRVGRCNVRLWNTTTAETYHQFMVEDNSIVLQVAFSSEGRMVAAICGISFVYVWSVETLTLLRKLNHSSGTQGEGSLLFSSDSSLLVACRGGLVRIWNTSTMTRIFQWDNWKEGIYYMLNIYGLSCDDTWLAGEDRREIHVLNIRTKAQICSMNPSSHTFEGYLGSSGAMSPTDASLLAVNRYANPEPSLIELWKIGEELQLVGSLALPEVISPRISFSQDGYYIACGLRCIEIMPNSLRLYAGNSPPESFRDSGFRTSSFLAYHDGWIHSGFPRLALMPIPVDLQAVELDQQMLAYGESIVIMSNTDDPILVDCSPLLARARRGELLRVKYQPPDDC
ncbi:hypothetical protein FRC17_000540 [Serendipita sp. 399]|nr:hypothetical protein FRC17_000540 [Serendipita sp. 399]